jgi:hypothetical protein
LPDGVSVFLVTAKQQRKPVRSPNKPNGHRVQVIRAELAESDTATACGIVAQSSSPLIALCRKLIDAGHDPATALRAYRGDTLCLIVRSIGAATTLEINGAGTGFRPAREPDAAPPMRQNKQGSE